MTRYVIGPDIALEFARRRSRPAGGVQLVAPTLSRAQLLARLYRAVQAGQLNRTSADEYLDHARMLRIRLLGDRVLQRAAWQVATHFEWPDTYTAEYIALTRLQADAFVTLDPELARTAATLVPVAAVDELLVRQ